ncbi:MAG: formylglycine-generating enzyme family protein [Bryobacteraceae bacterium]
MTPRMLVLLVALSLVAYGVPASASKQVKVSRKDGQRYVFIPGGSYNMGCSPGDRECYLWEPPSHHVEIRKGFWIGETEVTQQAYRRLTGKDPSRYKGAQRPADQISWYDARAYCQAIGMRLPTEAEWEYAGRGGTASARYGLIDSVAWYDGNSNDQTHDVRQKKPNAYGLYDVLGNVWEWVEDAFAGDKTMRILRGGSFYNLARDVRASSRLWAVPSTAHRDMGFRCAGD